ncbi:MAG: hemolysin III family protein [Rhodospirillaceae bacterium]|nr:hemolysin III family protein [Rhodospirillaceae bacterium]
MEMTEAIATHGERVADAVVHSIGVILALVSVPVLITLTAAIDGSGPVIAGVAVYGAGLLAMLATSALYHLVPASPLGREILRRCDHAVIYLKIAATQTPFAILVGGENTWWIMTVLWTTAGLGALGKVLVPHRMGRLAVPLYLVLGWLGMALVWPGTDGSALSTATFVLTLVGGGVYSLGVAFYLMDRLRFNIAIWHGFVLVASFVFYSAVLVEISVRAAPGLV